MPIQDRIPRTTMVDDKLKLDTPRAIHEAPIVNA